MNDDWSWEVPKEYSHIDDAICDILRDHGPDGHIDGHHLLTRYVADSVNTERERCARIAHELAADVASGGESMFIIEERIRDGK